MTGEHVIAGTGTSSPGAGGAALRPGGVDFIDMEALRKLDIGNARRMRMAGKVLLVPIAGAGHMLPYEHPSNPPSPTLLVASSAEGGRSERVSP